MKNFFILLFYSALLSSCNNINDKTPSKRYITVRQNFPDYPPMVVKQHLETAFDSVRWVFYKKFGCNTCTMLLERALPSKQGSDKVNRFQHYENLEDTSIVFPNLRMVSYAIDVDTILKTGDTLHFVVKSMINDTMYCCRVKNEDNYRGFPSSVIGFSVSKQRVIYSKQSSLTFFNGVWDRPKESHEALKKLLTCTLDSTAIINPWLASQLRKIRTQ
ncbi:MAG: hypothetical protein JNM36_04150 [Chitinophagales bacterium]|nr:hypothetical protein [Chitinophagales bacterium]